MSHPHIQSCCSSLSRNFHLCRNFLELLEGDWSNRECVFVSQPHNSDCRNSSYSNLTMHWRLTKIVEKNPCILIYLVHDFFPCKKLQDSLGFWTPRRGFRIPGTGFQSLSVKLRFWILIVSGIPDSKFQYFGFHRQNFPECRITRAKISRILEPEFPYVGRHDSKRYCGFHYQI